MAKTYSKTRAFWQRIFKSRNQGGEEENVKEQIMYDRWEEEARL